MPALPSPNNTVLLGGRALVVSDNDPAFAAEPLAFLPVVTQRSAATYLWNLNRPEFAGE